MTTNLVQVLSNLHDNSELINKWSEKPVKITKERMFEIPEGFNLIIAYTGDVNSQLVSFEFPRYHEGHDLSLCLNQKLKWKNIKSGAEGASNLIQKQDKTAEVWQAAWVIPPEIATSAGSVEISISLYDVVDNKLAFSWNTAQFGEFLIGEGGQSVGEEINNQYLPAKDEVLIVDADNHSIKAPKGYNLVVGNYGEIGTSTLYFEVNQFISEMDLLDEEIRVYLSVIFDNELATEYELDKEICFKQYFHTNEGNKFNKILVAWDIPKDITNNQQGYTGKFTLSLKVERFVGGVVTKRWVTSPFTDLAIGSSLILHDINSFISRDEQALQKAVEQSVNSALAGKADKSQAIFYIQGGGTTDTTNKTATWTGSHSDITEYYDGLMIAYKVGTAASTTTTLNINNLGAVKVVRNVTTAVSTVYGVDAIVLLTYTTDSSGISYWKVADYDSDTKTRSSNKADTKMYIIGASSQSTSGQTTYSNSKCYIGADNCLYSDGKKVITASDRPEDTKAFYITVTPQSNGRYTIDKTTREIVESYDAGYSLYAVYGQSENNDAASAVHSLTAYRYGQPEGAPEGAMEFYFEFSLSNISLVSDSSGIFETMIVISGNYYQENEQYTCTVRTDSLSHNVATTTSNGLMSAEDKKKLDGIAAEAMTFSEIDAICVIPLDSGLYQDGVMTMSWDELFDNNIFDENLFINAGRLVANNKTSLVGELILFPDAYMLDSEAFSDATLLTSVTIPATISKIGADAFSNCTSLTSVKFEGTMSQWSELDRLSGLSVSGKPYWAANTPFTQIICSDGTITL